MRNNARLLCVGDSYFAAAEIMEDGSFAAGDLPPGKYRLAVMDYSSVGLGGDNNMRTKEVTVPPDKDVEGVTLP